jgi:hypothetical protein
MAAQGPAITGQLGERPVMEDNTSLPTQSLVCAAHQPEFVRPLPQQAALAPVLSVTEPDEVSSTPHPQAGERSDP